MSIGGRRSFGVGERRFWDSGAKLRCKGVAERDRLIVVGRHVHILGRGWYEGGSRVLPLGRVAL
jgi:hypothetical protein